MYVGLRTDESASEDGGWSHIACTVLCIRGLLAGLPYFVINNLMNDNFSLPKG